MRNHGLPLEALRYPITPPGLHYTLIHYDVPAVDPDPGRSMWADGSSAPFASRSPACARGRERASRSRSNAPATAGPSWTRAR